MESLYLSLHGSDSVLPLWWNTGKAKLDLLPPFVHRKDLIFVMPRFRYPDVLHTGASIRTGPADEHLSTDLLRTHDRVDYLGGGCVVAAGVRHRLRTVLRTGQPGSEDFHQRQTVFFAISKSFPD